MSTIVPDFSYSSKIGRDLRIGVNPHFVGKLSKDAPDPVWYALNASFDHVTLTLHELATHIGQGHAITALCRGKRSTDNYIGAQHIGVDFDTEDSRSSLDALQDHPFIAQHAAIIHTTSSHTPEAPRARVIFILEQQITDPEQYSRYAIALNWYFSISDEKCHDAARLWFGAAGCEVRTLGNALPVAVLDDLVAQYEASQPPAPEFTPFVSADVSTLLDEAVKRGTPGQRNSTGFWLACQLRDSGYDLESARDVVQTYQMTVERTGNHTYTLVEAVASLSSAYKRKPRTDATIDQIEAAVIDGSICLPANVQKTLFGMTTLARRQNSVEGFTASLREIERESGVGKTNVAHHINDLIDIGVISRLAKADYHRGSRYKLVCTVNVSRKIGTFGSGGESPAMNVPILRETLDIATPKQVTAYHDLQTEALCGIRARVQPELAQDEAANGLSFGSSAQLIIATLVAAKGPLSAPDLQELTHLSRNTLREKVHRLELAGIVVTVKIGGQGNPRRVSLVPNWREVMAEISPSLTTWGQAELRGQKAARQRQRHHGKMLETAHDPARRAVSERAIKRAIEEEKFYAAQVAGRNAERDDWAQRQGMDLANVPPVSLQPIRQPAPEIEQDPLVVKRKGRTLKPAGKVRTGKNGLLRSERADYVPDLPPGDPLEPLSPGLKNLLLEARQRADAAFDARRSVQRSLVPAGVQL